MPSKNRRYISLGVTPDLMRMIEAYHAATMPYASLTATILRLVQRGLECEGYPLTDPPKPTTTQ